MNEQIYTFLLLNPLVSLALGSLSVGESKETVNYSHCYDKMPHEKQRKGGFSLARGLRVMFHRSREAWPRQQFLLGQWEYEAAGLHPEGPRNREICRATAELQGSPHQWPQLPKLCLHLRTKSQDKGGWRELFDTQTVTGAVLVCCCCNNGQGSLACATHRHFLCIF